MVAVDKEREGSGCIRLISAEMKSFFALFLALGQRKDGELLAVEPASERISIVLEFITAFLILAKI